MSPRLVALLLLLTASCGCAHATPRLRLARTLVASGAVLVVAGALVSTGCVGNGCAAGPEDMDLQAGLPVLAVGAALIAAGLLSKPREPARLFRSPASYPPGPAPRAP